MVVSSKSSRRRSTAATVINAAAAYSSLAGFSATPQRRVLANQADQNLTNTVFRHWRWRRSIPSWYGNRRHRRNLFCRPSNGTITAEVIQYLIIFSRRPHTDAAKTANHQVQAVTYFLVSRWIKGAVLFSWSCHEGTAFATPCARVSSRSSILANSTLRAALY